jgi:hypothetical protein
MPDVDLQVSPFSWLWFFVGTSAGIAITLGAIKYGEMWALMRIDQHLLERRRERPSALPDHREPTEMDIKALDAMDVYLDALERERRLRKATETSH